VTAFPAVPSHHLRVDVHLRPTALRTALQTDVRAGLTATPKALPPTWFYGARGSELFDQITRLPEYYPTRRERAILGDHADHVAAVTRADTLIELGSGTSEKTRILLDALRAAGTLTRFIPFDVDEAVLRWAGAEVQQEYPTLDVHAVVGDFEHHLPLLPSGGRRLIAFLGGTIGNLEPPQRRHFLTTLASVMGPEDFLLLGTDLVKDPKRLVRAYDDDQGVTAEFNRNVLAVLRRELEADIDPDAFTHVALWDADNEWIEMRLRATRRLTVRVLDLDVTFDDGEEIRTEISAKFRREGIATELSEAGLDLQHWWTDEQGDFAVSLSRTAQS
jgi:L-histidine N-alpha-methyltransferase